MLEDERDHTNCNDEMSNMTVGAPLLLTVRPRKVS